MESDKMESRMAEREAQRDKERGPLFLLPPIPRREDDILPYMYPWSDDCDWMELADNLWRDFDSDVSDDEDFNKLLKNLMAEREAQFFWDYTYRSPPRRVEFSLSEKKRIVSAVDDWISSLDDPVLFTRMAVRRAQLVMERWVDFGSDVSAVEDFNKLLDDLMAVRRAQRYMQRRGDCSLSEKKRIVSAVDNWINSLDDQMAVRMAQLCMAIWRFFGSDMSDVEDFNKLLKNLRRAEREALLYMLRRALFCPCDLSHTPPHLRLLDFDVSAVEKWIKLLDDLMATGSLESIDSDVSLKSDWSAEEQIDFKDRVFLRPDFSSSEEHDVSDDEDWVKSSDHHRSDFSSSEKKHVVADDEDWVKSPDDLMATGSLESNDSGVSLKSDRSKGGGIDFKDRVSLSRPDFSSSEEEDVSDDEDWVKSSDSQREDDILPYMYPWSDDCDWMELADNLGGHEPGVVV